MTAGGVTSLEEVLRQIVREEVRAALRDMHAQRTPEFARELSMQQVADISGKSVRTVRRWVTSGTLPSTQFAPNGPRTVNMADLERFLRDHRQQGGVACDEPVPITPRGRQLPKARAR